MTEEDASAAWVIAYCRACDDGRPSYWSGNRSWTYDPILFRVKRFESEEAALRAFDYFSRAYGFTKPEGAEAVPAPQPTSPTNWVVARHQDGGHAKYWCGEDRWSPNPRSPDARWCATDAAALGAYADTARRLGLAPCEVAAERVLGRQQQPWWDSGTGRGYPCGAGKTVSWPDETRARQELVRAWSRHSVRRERDVYQCTDCQRWHFTSSNRTPSQNDD